MRNQKKLIVDQLDRKMVSFKEACTVETPQKGWIHTIRTALNMTLQQLGNQLNITSQGAKDIEERESSGSISIKSLREAGKALNLQLVYGFVPLHGSLNQLIEDKAKQLAQKIISRAHHNMVMEDQGTTDAYIKSAVDELADEIKREMRRSLWD